MLGNKRRPKYKGYACDLERISRVGDMDTVVEKDGDLTWFDYLVEPRGESLLREIV